MEVQTEISPPLTKGVILVKSEPMGTKRHNGSLYTSIQNKVAHLEFGHPASNSFVSELLDRLAAEFRALSKNGDVSVIVLRSEGERAFCAGASLNELIAIKSLEEGKAFFSGFARVINAMRTCQKPIIGRVQGKAVGGGVGLAASCDLVYATEAASIRLSELSIGIAPLVIAPAVERKIGKSGLAELALAPEEWKNSYWAMEKGLYSKVFDSLNSLDKELDFQAEKLAALSPEALSSLKSILWEGTGHWDSLLEERAELSGRLALTDFTRHSLDKFRKE